MTQEFIQRRLLYSIHQAFFEELKDMRLSKEDAKIAIRGITKGTLSNTLASSAQQALNEYHSYLDSAGE